MSSGSQPMAVVFKTMDGGTYEMYVPPGFASVVANGGILVITEKSEVAGIVSVRPLPGGETADADPGEDGEQGTGPDMDQRQPDDGGFLEDSGGSDGRGEAAASPEGGRVHGASDGRSGSRCIFCHESYQDCLAAPCPDRILHDHVTDSFPDAGGSTDDPDDGA